MPIDLSVVNWAYVGILTLLSFITALLGSLIAFRNRLAGAVIAAVLFAIGFIFWTYYPHESLPGPISVTPGGVPTPAVTPAPVTPSPMAPAR